MRVKVTVDLELSDEFMENILITAFDGAYGGCWHWCHPWKVTGGISPWVIKDGVWRSVTVKVIDSTQVITVDRAVLAHGIERLFNPGSMPNRGDIRSAIMMQEAGDIDADAADVIVQLGAFGVVIYG